MATQFIEDYIMPRKFDGAETKSIRVRNAKPKLQTYAPYRRSLSSTEKKQIQKEARRNLRKQKFKEYNDRINREWEKARKNVGVKRLKGKQLRAARKMPAHLRKGYSGGRAAGIAKGVVSLMGLGQAGVAVGSVSSKANVEGRGRGRPTGSYIPRYLPGVGMVKMPIQAYKRALSASKAKMRLQRELQSARLASTPPPDHVRGGYPDGADEWLDAGDPQADMQMQQEQAMMMQQQAQMDPRMQQQMPQRQGMMSRLGAAIARKRMQQQMAQQQQMAMQGQQGMGPSGPTRIPLMRGAPPAPRLSVWGDPRANIINTPNIFNNPGQTQVRP